MHLCEANLAGFLRDVGLDLAPGPIRIEPAGEGNINFVRRVIDSAGQSIIVKQARPALEKFPEYRVTTERILFEHRYLSAASRLAPAQRGVLPRVLQFDEDARVLILEDLGRGPDLSQPLLAGEPPIAALSELGAFLGRVHQGSAGCVADLEAQFHNGEMQNLHGEHIFSLPFAPNEFPVSAEASRQRRCGLARPGVRERIGELRRAYYESRLALVHADVQTSNVLLRDGRPRLLDAEIAHVGDPAFDLGTLLAHIHVHVALRLTACDCAAVEREVCRSYTDEGGREDTVARAYGYAGVEILRRTLGAAQLPFLQDPAIAAACTMHGFELLMR